MIKKTIHFNDETLNDIDTLINYLGVAGYGDIPKAIKFSVTFTLNRLLEDSKVIPSLNADDLELWFSSIKKIKKSVGKVN